MPEMTELEGTVLGLIALHPESTAYEVRREFQKSRTAHWRASAGAIYPLIERLVKRDLLTARSIGGANGLTDYLTREVSVRMDMDDAAQVKTLAHEVAAARHERLRVERRVTMLRPDSIDPDLLEERARAVLNLGYADDRIILRPGKSN